MVEEAPVALAELHLSLRVLCSPLQGLLTLGAAAPKSLLKLSQIRRRDENVLGIGEGAPLLDLLGTLDVDVQQTDLPLLPDGLYSGLRRPVDVAVHMRKLDELVGLLRLPLHGLQVGEVVVHAIRLPGPRCAGGVGDGEAKEPGQRLLDPFYDGALAHARRPNDDERAQALHREHGLGRLGRRFLRCCLGWCRSLRCSRGWRHCLRRCRNCGSGQAGKASRGRHRLRL
mmetsp:Transcript_6690/g.18327  ORF Transcript_6690/g.18327 Transcript_6690/m.18327 type:complete len:228 (-) Transcript_6690:1109-1792(-)